MNQATVLILLASTALPSGGRVSDILDQLGAFEGEDGGILLISFSDAPDPGWHGAVDMVSPLEERLVTLPPPEFHRSKYERLRDVHQPPPRVLGRKDYGRLDFRKGR